MVNLPIKWIVGAVAGLAVIGGLLFLLWRVDDLSKDNKEHKKTIAAYETTVKQLTQAHAKQQKMIVKNAQSSIQNEKKRSEILVEVEKYEDSDPRVFDFVVDRLFFPAEASAGSSRNQTARGNASVQKP